jgi:hypothetical protein
MPRGSSYQASITGLTFILVLEKSYINHIKISEKHKLLKIYNNKTTKIKLSLKKFGFGL